MRLRLAAAAALLAGAALAVVAPAPADAHAYIVSASPAQGTTVSGRPTSVRLVFDETLLDLGRNAIGVEDPAGRQVATGCATADGPRLSVPVRLDRSGEYRVTWRASSADGHLVGDTYTFRYRAPAGEAATPAPTAAPPSCAPVGAAAAPAPPGLSPAVVIAIVVAGVVVLAVVAVAIVAVVAVRRADGADPEAAPDAHGGGSPP